jgi:CRISPR/Cas system-associated exonuclease Cas4 (RecB family)
MTYSFTQINQYLTCPHRYRHRYLDGWKEKDTRAAMLFGRAFERALARSFAGKIPALCCSPNGLPARAKACITPTETPGIACLAGNHAPDSLLPRQPRSDQSASTKSADQVHRSVGGRNDFVAYIDAIGKLDGKRCLLEWKTSSSRYPEEPDGPLSLDPQLVCYSWMTGIAEVAQVVFVRKRLVEVQYLRTTITDEQREEFGHLVEGTIRRIESADFLPHSGIRFPQNPCSSCPYVGLCLGKQEMVDAAVVRRPGAESLDWLDELSY